MSDSNQEIRDDSDTPEVSGNEDNKDVNDQLPKIDKNKEPYVEIVTETDNNNNDEQSNEDKQTINAPFPINIPISPAQAPPPIDPIPVAAEITKLLIKSIMCITAGFLLFSMTLFYLMGCNDKAIDLIKTLLPVITLLIGLMSSLGFVNLKIK
jgi:hypothetical protein